MRNYLFTLTAFLACLCFYSCSGDTIFHQYKDIDRQLGWDKDSILSFQFSVPDTLSSYKVSVELRNTNDYSYENMWIYMHTSLADSSSIPFPVNIPLADPQGNWYGRRWGSYYTTKMLVYDHLKVSDTSALRIFVQHAIRADELKGIASIGLLVEKNNDEEKK